MQNALRILVGCEVVEFGSEGEEVVRVHDREGVFITDAMSGLVAAGGRDPLAPLRARCDCLVWGSPQRPGPSDWRASLRGRQALLCLLTDRIDAEVISAATALRVISTVSVGVDHIDVHAATARGIHVGHTPGVLSETTAELTMALLLAVARRIPEADADLRSGRWTPERRWTLDGHLGRDLAGATLGVVGLGGVGRAVAARAKAFGMRVLGWSRTPRELPGVTAVALSELLAESDFVSLHVASTPETRGLIDRAAFARMKRGAILINTARGDVVDEADLVDALASGHLAGAGLDVFATEPIGADHPLVRFRNVVLLPHIGSASIATRLRMVDLAVANVLAVLDGGAPTHAANAVPDPSA